MLTLDLSSHRALISGSTAGIGRTIATTLAGCGADVIVNGRDDIAVKAVVAQLSDQFPQRHITGVAADVGTAEGCERLIEAADGVDVLVCNAAIYGRRPFADITDADWAEYFEVNVMSAIRLCRPLVPRMVAAGWGRVVMISSEAAVYVPATMVHYGWSKASLLAIARGIAETYPASGVTINSVLPGTTHSRGVDGFIGRLAATEGISIHEAETRYMADQRPTSLLKRVIDAEEVANLVAYLCSPLASATTGAALRVEGGTIRSVP